MSIIQDIQNAFENSPEDIKSVEFLNYLKKDLPHIIFTYLENNPVWLDVKEVESPLNNCHKLELGNVTLPNQSRYHKHGRLDYRWETRSVKKIAYAEFCHPTLDEIWDDTKKCAILATILAVISAIIAEDYEAAMAVFYPVFYECLEQAIGERAKDVEVKFSSDTVYNCWTNHCS